MSVALRRMNELNRKLLLIVDGDMFKGLFSIGDIQRAILAGTNLSLPIAGNLRDDCLTASEEEPLEQIKTVMLRNRVEYMPLLDRNGALTKVIFWEDLFGDSPRRRTSLDIPVIIMAGGKGMRLKPLTNVIPKALIPVHEKPVIEEIVDRFCEQGVKHFFVSINYKGKMIRDYFDERLAKKYRIEFFAEDEPMGTAGSLRLVTDRISGTFIVTNCDIIVDHDYAEILAFHKANGFCMTMVSALKTTSIPYGVVRTGEGGVLLGIDEKPETSYQVNTGLYVLEPQALTYVPKQGIFHITHLMDALMAAGERVGVYPVNERSWMDMGEWGELQRMTRLLLGDAKSGT